MFKFLEKIVTPPASAPQITEKDLMVATAGLFLEMVYADFDVHPEEEAQMVKALQSLFDLSEQDIEPLLGEARATREQRQDIWRFASVLKDHLSRQQRLRILQYLWKIVFADGRVDRYEDALMHKITNLLALDHSDMIEAKLAVKKAL